MKSVRIKLSAWLAPIAIVLSVASLTLAQNDEITTESERLQNMISERQDQLELRLKNLSITRESLGDKHPSAERVKGQIADTEREIKILKERESILEINDRDMRILVFRLALQVDRLENEVAALKQRIPRRSGGARGLGRVPGR